MTRRHLGLVSRRIGLAPLVAALVLGGCAGGGDEGPARHAQADLAGTWDFAKLRVGASPGWERGTSSVNAAGAVTLLSYLDDTGSDPGPQGSSVVAVDPETGDLTARAGGIAAPFHGTLSLGKDLFAAVETPEAATCALMLARRRGGATYSDADLRGRTFALHALRVGGTVGEWRYGTGSVDAQGLVALGQVIGPQLVEVAKPPPHGATLTVDAEGRLGRRGLPGLPLPGQERARGRASRSVGGARATAHDPRLHRACLRAGGPRGDLGCERLRGNVAPIWYHARLAIGPAGSAQYLPPYLDSTGATTLPPVVTIALAPDGTMTQGATNPSYRGTLSTNAAHNPPGRYGLGIAMRR